MRKILSMMAASGVLMFVSLTESIVFAGVSGISAGNMGGIVIFWIGKWILSAAFAAAIMWSVIYSLLSASLLKRRDI